MKALAAAEPETHHVVNEDGKAFIGGCAKMSDREADALMAPFFAERQLRLSLTFADPAVQRCPFPHFDLLRDHARLSSQTGLVQPGGVRRR
jgi:hypothetical protein